MLKVYLTSFALSLIISAFSSAQAKHACSSDFCHSVVGKECMKACGVEFPHYQNHDNKEKCRNLCLHVGTTCSGKKK